MPISIFVCFSVFQFIFYFLMKKFVQSYAGEDKVWQTASRAFIDSLLQILE